MIGQYWKTIPSQLWSSGSLTLRWGESLDLYPGERHVMLKLSGELKVESVCFWLLPDLDGHPTTAHSCIFGRFSGLRWVDSTGIWLPVMIIVKALLSILSMGEIIISDFGFQHIDSNSPLRGETHTSWKDRHITQDTSSMSRINRGRDDKEKHQGGKPML